jgi:redox-regulated HSP33 family molecular chaperone
MTSTKSKEQSRQPSKQFLEAIAHLRKFDEDFYLNLTEDQQRLEYDKEDKIYDLGKKEGLSRDYIQDLLDIHHRVEITCQDCKQKQVSIRLQCNEPEDGVKELMHEIPLCSECKEKRDHDEWKEENERLRNKETKNPIIGYCDKIRNEIPEADLTWQQYQERDAAMKEAVGLVSRKISDALDNQPEDPERVYKRTGKYPDGSKNKTQWLKHLKNMRRLEKQQKLEAKTDVALRSKTPIRMLENTIMEIGCRCQVEDMRQGVFCDTCRLLVHVHKYMLDLFKEAAKTRR